ncbi:MAG: caspase family protein [Rhodosalinus sp.]|uniref:caspase family protein n=1 Tax=Rhodosalinus sp. TaxID=2047741 RepID=UPI0039785EC0
MRALGFVLLLILPGIAVASDRVALVIGMSDYETVVDLDNTLNDARDIGDTLNRIGFEVTTVLDAGGGELRDALDSFAFRAETADLALIYFAGHGVEVQGANYLIPVDADVRSNRDIQRQSVSLDMMLAAVDGARKMRIVILDSCRDNPFGDVLDIAALRETEARAEAVRSLGGGGAGLAPPSPDRGTMVAFAAKDGEKALDGSGDNSPFAIALMDALPQQGLEISLMFRQVRDRVLEITGNLQEPHTYGSLSGTPFYLAGASDGVTRISAEDPREAWSAIQPDQQERLAALASQGDTRSMLGLAYIHLNTADPRHDPAEARKLLERAAEAGSAEAQFELARMLEQGVGAERNIDRALDLYRAAAAQGFPDALNDLGFLNYQGEHGLARDVPRALELFQKAADARHPEAMFNVAALIDDGLIEGRGPEDAARYLYRALRSGHSEVYAILREQPGMFKLETRKALQRELRRYALYDGMIDGDFGPGTQRGLSRAYGETSG